MNNKRWLFLIGLLFILLQPIQPIWGVEPTREEKNKLALSIAQQLDKGVDRLEPNMVRPFFRAYIASFYLMLDTDKKKIVPPIDQAFKEYNRLTEDQWQVGINEGLFSSVDSLEEEKLSFLTELAKVYATYDEYSKVKKILKIIPPSNRNTVYEELAKTFLENKHLPDALHMADQLEEPATRLGLFVEIAYTEAEIGDKKQADRLLRKVMKEIRLLGGEWSSLLSRVVQCNLELRDYEAALQIADSIPNIKDKVVSYEEIADVLLRTGEKTRAFLVMDEQYKLLVQLEDNPDKVKQLIKLAKKAGIDQKLKIVDILSHASCVIDNLPTAEQSGLRSELVRSYLDVGESELALQQITQFSKIKEEVTELIGMAEVYRKTQPEQEERLLSLSLQRAEQIKDALDCADNMAKVIGAYFEGGQEKLAQELAWNRKGVYNQSVAMVELVRCYLDKNSFDPALAIALSIPNYYRRSYSLNLIADQVARNGNREWAFQLLNQALAEARQLKETSFKQDRYFGISISFVQNDQYESALVLVDQLNKPESKVKILTAMAGRMKDLEQLERLLGIADRMGELELKAEILTEMAERMKDPGELDRLLGIADQMGNIQLRMKLIQNKVELLMDAGKVEKALAIATTLEPGDARESLLDEIALKLIDQGFILPAREIAKQLRDPSLIISGIVNYQAKNGQYEAAMATLNEVKTFSSKRDTLFWMVFSINDMYHFQ